MLFIGLVLEAWVGFSSILFWVIKTFGFFAFCSIRFSSHRLTKLYHVYSSMKIIEYLWGNTKLNMKGLIDFRPFCLQLNIFSSIVRSQFFELVKTFSINKIFLKFECPRHRLINMTKSSNVNCFALAVAISIKNPFMPKQHECSSKYKQFTVQLFSSL